MPCAFSAVRLGQLSARDHSASQPSSSVQPPIPTYVSPPGTKNAGEPIADSTLCNYMSRLINFAATKFRAKSLIPATKDFFACLDAGSQQPSAKWLRGMKAKIQKIHFERAVKKGDNLDKSECEGLGI